MEPGNVIGLPLMCASANPAREERRQQPSVFAPSEEEPHYGIDRYAAHFWGDTTHFKHRQTVVLS